jgi:site-specific recombinase XerD
MFIFKRNGFYQIQFVDDETGKIRRVSTRSKIKSEALKFLSDFRKVQSSLESKTVIEIKLGQFEEEYIRFISLAKSNSYIKSVKLSFRMLMRFCGDIDLATIDNRVADQFVIEMFARRRFAAALYYRTLKAAFTKASEWNYLISNPFSKIKLPKIPKVIPAFLSMKEILLIIENTSKDSMKSIFLFAAHTGLRLSEILNLHWQDVDLHNNRVKISNTETFNTKGKKDRYIPINNTVKELLESNNEKKMDCARYVFCNKNNCRYNADYVSKQFKKAVRLACLDDKIHFHSLRHGFASNLVQRSVPLFSISLLLGHSNLSTTQIYSHLRQEDLLKAVQLLDAKNEE